MGLYGAFQQFLDNDQYTEAALLIWGRQLFDPRPRSVQRIWRALMTEPKILIPGGGSQGKSFTPAAWAVLNWVRDPAYTSGKIVSVTESHAASNIMATIKMFHENSALTLPGRVMDRSIDLGNGDKRASIVLVALPPGEDVKGRLRGFHPVPRPKRHPQFGSKTRIFVLIDEGEDAPAGVWEGLENILSTQSAKGEVNLISIVSGANPKKRESPYAQRAEPPGGWPNFNIETSQEWYGPEKLGKWFILRIDPAKSENVIEKREVYPGMMTYEGFMDYYRKGETHPDYYCVDDQTEVLSNHGWVNYSGLNVGQQIYTVNPVTGLSEWQDVLEVFSKEYSGELVSMEGRGLSALVTPNHRWAVTNKCRLKYSNKRQLSFKETGSLAIHDLIPIARPPKPPKIAKYSPDFAAIVGWVITDGSYMPLGDGSRVTIYQSHKANAVKCCIIRDLLGRAGAKFTECKNKAGITSFYISGDVAYTIREVTNGNKRLTLKFIRNLSLESREALLQAMILGDGGTQGGSTEYLCVRDQEQAGIYAALIVMTGRACTTHFRIVPPSKFMSERGYDSGGPMYYINIKQSFYARNQYLVYSNRQYSGTVWCPRTKNGTFLARRKGHTYFTGNTFARGAWPEGISEFHVTPSYFFNDSVGIYRWQGSDVTSVASLDPAFAEGGDNPVLTVGRYGKAIGFTHVDGRYQSFDSTKNVLQLEQQLMIRKDNTLLMADEVMNYLRNFQVRPEYFVIDKTGAGLGLHDALLMKFGSISGVQWSEKATERKILQEDTMTAEERYSGVVSEMAFAFATWLQYGYIKIAPMMNAIKLQSQATGRKYYYDGRGLIRVQSKADFKTETGGLSPDEYDSAIMLPHLIRLRQSQNAAMLPGQIPISSSERVNELRESITARPTFYDTT